MDHPPAATSGAVPHFYGRDEELGWLYDLFNEVAKDGGPRLAVILAESGIGKTALVQALYRKLTTDQSWDGPSPGGYWPDAFQGSGGDLKVNPDFPEDYRPVEPPKFMWLGIRCDSPQDCPLLGVRGVLDRHAEVVRGMLPVWKGILHRLKKQGPDLGKGVAEEGVTIGVEALAGIAVGSLAPVVKPGIKATRDAIRGKGVHHRDLEEAEQRSAGQELCREFGRLMGGKQPLPTIVWLDDAQWIDTSSIEFLEKLFRLAKRRKWPLFVIATHWEREWKEHLKDGSGSGPSLTRFSDPSFDGNPQTEVQVLEKGDQEALRSRLLDRLPGLKGKKDQQDLMIKKSDRNFLYLEENIGDLLLTKRRNFEDGDPTRALTTTAMKLIEGWEYDRRRRVLQRFEALEEEIRDILGWSSRAGSRFFRKMIADFAQERTENDSEGLISTCVDPCVILSESEDRPVMEFRDHAYYQYAISHFETFLRGENDEELKIFIDFIEEWFSDWVNGCFDDDGQTLSPEYAPEPSLLAASPAERVEFLEMIVESLPMKEEPDWSSERDAAALRAHCMLVEAHSQMRLWDQCRRVAKSLEKTDWMAAPMTLFCFGRREDTCSYLETAGALFAADQLADSLLAACRGRFEEVGTPESLRDVTVSLERLGGIEAQRGELDRAYGRFAEALEISRRLAEELDAPESRRDVSFSLGWLGDIEAQRGELDRAYGRFAEALEIRERLAEALGTPESLRDVSVSLGHLGAIDEQRGELDRAYKRFAEALEIHRRLAKELGTPESLRDVSFSLEWLGDIEAERGERDRAYGRFSEALEIRRRLAEELGTPESLRDVSYSLESLGQLDRLGGLFEDLHGELDRARERFAEALEIRRDLAEALGTPESLRNVSVSLERLGDIEALRGELDRAYGRFAEALEISRRLAETLGTPESRRDVIAMEVRVQRVKALTEAGLIFVQRRSSENQ